MPELWALSILTVAGRPETPELDAASWTGLTLALACVYAPPDDLDLHIRLIGTGVQHAGNHLEEAISGLLDRASQDRVAVILSRLAPVLTPGLTRRLVGWAQDSQRPLALWETVQNALAEHGDQDVVTSLRPPEVGCAKRSGGSPSC